MFPQSRSPARPWGLIAAILGLALTPGCKQELASSSSFQSRTRTTASNASSSGVSGSGTGSSPGGATLTASARVLTESPFAASGQSHLAMNTDLTPYLDTVTLTGIRDSTAISDGYAKIVASSFAPGQSVAYTSNLEFPTSDPRFYQVMSYYHLHRMVAGLEQAGMLSGSFAPVEVDAQCSVGASSTNNAYYQPGTRRLCLGSSPQPDGVTRIWAATDPDVTAHEFGHAISHTLSTSEILGSHYEGGALDEGLGDFWAYLMNGSTGIGAWYGQALMSSLTGAPVNQAGGYPLRDLLSPRHYPDQLAWEIHEDSTVISPVLHQLAQVAPLNDSARMLRLVARLTSFLQSPASFGEFTRELLVEAAREGGEAQARAILTSQGLIRKDPVAQLSFNAADVRIGDDPDGIVYGNCNGQLDAGEYAILLVNVHNQAASDMGGVYGTLTTSAPSSEIRIISGWESGTFPRIKAGQGFFDSSPSTPGPILDSSGWWTQYGEEMSHSAFLVRALSGASGAYTFTLTLQAMNTVDSAANTAAIQFNLSVGSSYTTPQQCNVVNGKNVWP